MSQLPSGFSHLRLAGASLILLASIAASTSHMFAQNPTPAPTSNIAPAPRLEQQMLKTVVFLATTFRDGNTVKTAEGTAFFVGIPDSRLGNNGSFVYLVTNRHMVDPSADPSIGHPVQVLNYSIRCNRTLQTGSNEAAAALMNLTGIHWVLSDDPSVDLAVAGFAPDRAQVDYMQIPESDFATKDKVAAEEISPGDRVLFTGFFEQFPGIRQNEPVLREGILAMLPDEDMPTTLGRPGKIYLADIHAFHGNSGSPLFVRLSPYKDGGMFVGRDAQIYLIGIVSGYIFETNDLQLQTATTLTGSVLANSGITTVVPVDELGKILHGTELTKQRDDLIASIHSGPH